LWPTGDGIGDGSIVSID